LIDPADLLADLRSRGFALERRGEQLLVSPTGTGRLTDEDRAAIRAGKEALRALLAAEGNGHAPSPPPAADPAFVLVKDQGQLPAVLAALEVAGVVALDCETVGGPCPKQVEEAAVHYAWGHVRLLQLRGEAGPTFLVDCFAADPSPLWPALAGRGLIVHGADFDLAFLGRLGLIAGDAVHCTLTMSRLLHAGTREGNSLAECCRRWLGVELPKEQQLSDWSGDLSPQQLEYAARDVLHLHALHRVLAVECGRAGLTGTVELEEQSLHATLWMARSGVAIDRDAWLAQARAAEAEAERLRLEANALSPARPSPPAAPWRWDSRHDLRAAFGIPSAGKDAIRALVHPQGDLLRAYQAAEPGSEEATRLAAELTARVPPRPPPPPEPWNWRSHAQVKECFRLLGIALPDTEKTTLAGIAHPLAGAVVRYRSAASDAATRGPAWLEFVQGDGRVYPRWKPLGAVTGRLTTDEPMIQNFPKQDPDLEGESYLHHYRRCVVALPGRALVKADFSQLHLRIAASLVEPVMLEAFQRGDDLHTLTARGITGRQEVTKSERDRAKIANYSLMYGAGADGFFATTRCDYPDLGMTREEAAFVRAGFFRTYPGLRDWHQRQHNRPETVTAPSGRAVRDVVRFSEKLADRFLLVEADCLKGTLALLWERKHEVPGAFPVIACHDEVVMECDAGQAGAVAAWLEKCMLDASEPLLAPCPVKVEVTVGRNWAGDPPEPGGRQLPPVPNAGEAPSPPAQAVGKPDVVALNARQQERQAGVLAGLSPEERRRHARVSAGLPAEKTTEAGTPMSVVRRRRLEREEHRLAGPRAVEEAAPPSASWEVRVGDCREVLATLPDGSADLAVTDPPYGIGLHYHDQYDDDQPAAEFLGLLEGALRQVYRVLKRAGSLFLFMGPKYQAEALVLLKHIGFHWRRTIAWHNTFGQAQQNNFTPTWTAIHYVVKDPQGYTFNADAVRVPSARQLLYNDKRASPRGKLPDDFWVLAGEAREAGFFSPEGDAWLESRVCGTFKERVGHVTQLPLTLVERIVKVASNPGDVVLDPFLGSGTVLVAAARPGRRGIGVELSEKTAALARERLDKEDKSLAPISDASPGTR
jgi:DNA polymerase I-like protein with 3'-5' exonuclease and polymerase domains/DNA modification methylase